MNPKHRIIVDCDPGVDDAIAIFMALASSHINVLGLTTVAGNVGIDQVTMNARSIVTMSGSAVPVCQGASASPREGQSIHGSNGVGDVVLPAATLEKEGRSAVEFIWEQACTFSGELEIVAIGPLSNIANALQAHPQLVHQIRRISLMGGAMGSGNITPAAEFNIFADPYAAAAVFQSGIPIDMYGLDATNRAIFTAKEISALRATGLPIPVICCDMLHAYTAFYKSRGFLGPALHDPLTVAGVIDESIIEFLPCHVAVELCDKSTLGKTKVCIKESHGTRVAVNIDRPKFIRLLTRLLVSLNF